MRERLVRIFTLAHQIESSSATMGPPIENGLTTDWKNHKTTSCFQSQVVYVSLVTVSLSLSSGANVNFMTDMTVKDRQVHI